MPCLNVRRVTTPETEGCSGTEEKEDRENFQVIKLFERHWIPSEAKREPVWIFSMEEFVMNRDCSF